MSLRKFSEVRSTAQLVEISLCQLKAVGMCTGAALVYAWWTGTSQAQLWSHCTNGRIEALKSISNLSLSPWAAVIPLTIWILPQMYISCSFPSPCKYNHVFLKINVLQRSMKQQRSMNKTLYVCSSSQYNLLEKDVCVKSFYINIFISH